jgi:hypothetical protein
MQRLGLVVKQLTDILPLVGVGSEPGKDVLKALNMLAKHVPPGAVTPAGEKQQLENMQTRNAQNNQQMQMMRQRMMQGGGGPGGAPGAGAGGPPGMAA